MSALAVAFVFFASALGAALFGIFLRGRLPEHHVSEHSRGVIILSTKLVATMTALLLGLLISSANDSLQGFSRGLEQMGARFATLDRLLGAYGPETRDMRHDLRKHMVLALVTVWPEEKGRVAGLVSPEDLAEAGAQGDSPAPVIGSPQVSRLTHSFHARMEGALLALSPADDAQRWRQSEALRQLGMLAEEHWLLVEQVHSTVPPTLVFLLLVWLVILFTTFGLFAPRNATVTTVFVLCALSASAAIFVILEMNSVTSGLMKVSGEPLVKALGVIGR